MPSADSRKPDRSSSIASNSALDNADAVRTLSWEATGNFAARIGAGSTPIAAVGVAECVLLNGAGLAGRIGGPETFFTDGGARAIIGGVATRWRGGGPGSLFEGSGGGGIALA